MIFQEVTTCMEQIAALKTRLGRHTKNQGAIENGRLQYLPGMSHLSTQRSVEQCVQDIWTMLDGSAMLELNFSKILAAVHRFRRAVKDLVGRSKIGKSKIKVIEG